jgi:hypothetical protein
MVKRTWEIGFLCGVLAALAQVADVGQETLYDEIVRTVGPVELWAAAEEFDREHLERRGHKPTGREADFVICPCGKAMPPMNASIEAKLEAGYSCCHATERKS